MGLLSVLRSGVKTANTVTKDLQANVTHEVPTGVDLRGKKTYGGAVVRPAIVEMKNQSVISASGELTFTRASILFLDATVMVGDDDRLTLPDGTTGPIVLRTGFVDRGTGRPVLTQVYLG